MATRAASVGHWLLLILAFALFASQAGAAIINPGFDTVTTGTTLQGWTFASTGPFSGGASTEFVTQGSGNARIFSQCALRQPCTSTLQNDFGSLSQSIDFTGVTALVLDVQLRQGGGTGGLNLWHNKFTGIILIDDDSIWSANAPTTLTNLNIPLVGLTGVHTLTFALFSRVDVALPTGSNHFNIDNLRTVGTPVPEPGTAALTLVGLLALGARRRARG
jgi:hypothetical protein